LGLTTANTTPAATEGCDAAAFKSSRFLLGCEPADTRFVGQAFGQSPQPKDALPFQPEIKMVRSCKVLLHHESAAGRWHTSLSAILVPHVKATPKDLSDARREFFLRSAGIQVSVQTFAREQRRVARCSSRRGRSCGRVRTISGGIASGGLWAAAGLRRLDWESVVRDFYRMKATTMTLSSKRQSVFPQDWCERVGLANGGPVNVFDLGEAGLLIRPVRPPSKQELEAALAAGRPRRAKPGEAERIVAEALRKAREES